RGRLRKAFARFKIHHVVMALKAVAFQEPLGSHWEDPMVVFEPTVFPCPAFSLLRVIWRMGGPFELGSTSLPVVTNGAAHDFLLVGTETADEQIESRMACVRLGQTAFDLKSERLA